MPDLEPPVVNPAEVGVSPAAPGEAELPGWLKSLQPSDVEPKTPTGPIPTAPRSEEDGGDGGKPPEALPVVPPVPGDGGKGPAEGGAHLAPERPDEVDVNKWRAERQLAPDVEAERLGRINGVIEKARSGAERVREVRPLDSTVAGIRESVAVAKGELELISKAGPEGVLSEADVALKGSQAELLLKEANDYQKSLDNYHRPHLEKLAESAINIAKKASIRAAEAKTAASLAANEERIVKERLTAKHEEWEKAGAAAMQIPEKYRGGVLSQIKAEKAEIEEAAVVAREAAEQRQTEAQAAAAEAEKAEADRSECEATVRHIEAQMNQAKMAAAQIKDELNRSHQISQETIQRGERLKAHIEEGEQVERAVAMADDVETVRKAFELVGGKPLPPGIETDLMNAVRGGLTGQEIGLHNYLVPLMKEINPETRRSYGDQPANELLKILGERAKQMQRLLALTVVESPDEVMQRMSEMTGVPRLPESFKQAVEAARQGRGYHQEVGAGSVEALRQTADLQGQAYFEVLQALGYKPESPLSAQEEEALMERARSGELKQQFAADVEEIIQGNLLKGAETTKKLGEVEGELGAAKLAVQAEEAAGAARAAELQAKLAAAQAAADAAGEKAKLMQERVDELTPVAGEVNRQLEAAINAVPEEIWDLIPEYEREEIGLGLQPGETIEERRAKIQAAAEKVLEVETGLEGKEGDAAHEAGVAEVLTATNDYYAGRLTPEQAADRVKKWRNKRIGGVAGVGGREKTPEELQAASLQVAGAEMEHMRRAKNLPRDQAQDIAGKASALNTALEGVGVLSAGMGGLLDAGFKLALESMFPTGGR